MRWSALTCAALAPLVLGLVDAEWSHDLTIDDVLEAPRPQAPVVSPDGTQAVQLVDKWDGKKDVMTRTLYLLSLNGSSHHPVTLLSGETGHINEPIWLTDDRLAYLNDTAFYHFGVSSHHVHPSLGFNFPNGTSPGSLVYQPDSGVLVFSGVVWKHDEEFENVAELDEAYGKRGDTGVIYEELFIRFWDHWLNPEQIYTIGTVKLHLAGDDVRVQEQSGRKFRNILKGTGLYAILGPYTPGDFTLSPTHIIVSSQPPEVPDEIQGRNSLYRLPLHTESGLGKVEEITPGPHGQISGVAFSPDFKKIVYTQPTVENSTWRRGHLMLRDLASGETTEWTPEWDRSPNNVQFSKDGSSLYFMAEDRGRVIPYHLSAPGQNPTPLEKEGTTTGLSILPGDRVLLTVNSMISPNEVFLRHRSSSATGDARQITHYSAYLSSKLAPFKPEEMWFKGGDDWDVQAWVVKPRDYSPAAAAAGKTWPLEFAVHGGPESQHEDAWVTRWNYALHAAQGYFIVLPNPGGSTGFGEAFQHRLTGKWGGPLLDDTLAAYHTALERFPIDKERTVMTGASYGGYAANWLQGHNDQFGFKAIVCHDGIFDLELMYFTDDAAPLLPVPAGEADPIADPKAYAKWSPKSFITQWKTPMMIIHSGNDYRCPIHEGIAAYKTLQAKNIPSRFLYFPDENHWVLKPHNARRWFKEIFRWMDEWVGEDAGEVQAQEKQKPLFTVQA